ncbi:hypothetical protein PRIPAC_77000 [Pristionchus pacificus]|uniref:Flavin-containing monooxygenase n=1 Tax=Pristionchus pacificus TaxID=54126 RepID=A0A2A6C1Z9_PRIPA|nr:hypothetical protein PRIPAC_77000 [Pristionchus pacificus]|eukprot:PDM72170.1 hypothetical protein PRIPAC_38604 [Pristionchus pacificus]
MRYCMDSMLSVMRDKETSEDCESTSPTRPRELQIILTSSESSVMNSTVINTSKELSAYSDFPPKAEEANFMHNRQMYQYFVDYANHFKINEYIEFYHKVVNVERADDYSKTGRWNVTVRNEFHEFHVYWSSHSSSFSTTVEGQREFQGQIMHAHSYKDHRGMANRHEAQWRNAEQFASDAARHEIGTAPLYLPHAVILCKSTKRQDSSFRSTDEMILGLENKVVAVVGIGNSGGDVAVELSKMAKQRFPNWLVETAAQRQLNRRFDHDLFRLKPDFGVFGAHPTVNDELPNRIAAGTVRVKPQIRRFTERGLEFDDGTKVDEVDTVVLATGYSFEFPILERGELVKVKENEVDLFQNVFPLSCEHDTLGIIGLIQPLGCILPIAEMQARVVLDVLAGRSKLPTLVDYIPYMDELAKLSYLPFDPVMAVHTLLSPATANFYRLRGPHPWYGAREAILTIEDRIVKATNSEKTCGIFSARHAYVNELLIFFGIVAYCLYRAFWH